MRSFVSERAALLKPSGIRKFFDIVHEKKNAISLGVGEPDFITPWDIRDAGIRSVQKGRTQYTGNRGLPELRENISRYLKERFNLDYSKEHIIVTVGASEAIDLTLRAVCEPGDEIIIPDPCYVSYAPCVSLNSAIPGAREMHGRKRVYNNARNARKGDNARDEGCYFSLSEQPDGWDNDEGAARKNSSRNRKTRSFSHIRRNLRMDLRMEEKPRPSPLCPA